MSKKLPKLYCQSRSSLLGRQFGDDLSEELDGLHYSDRGIPLATGEKGNIAVIHPSDNGPHIAWMMEQLRFAGLGPLPQILVADISELPGSGLDGHDFHPFIFYPNEHTFQPDNKWLEVVDEQDQIIRFIQVCRANGVPTPKTFIFRSKDRMENLNFDYPIWLKISRSFTGRGVFKANNAKELQDMLDLLSPDIAFQLQEDLSDRLITCLNLQYVAVNGKAVPTVLTDQELEGSVHVGNRYCGPYHYRSAWKVTNGLADSLAARGLKHTFAFDVAVVKTDQNGDYSYLVLENNPRINGSTTPSEIVRKLGYTGNWVAKPFKLGKPLDQVDLGEIIYSRKRGHGVVPHITSTVPKKHKISFTIMAQTDSMMLDLEERLKQQLN